MASAVAVATTTEVGGTTTIELRVSRRATPLLLAQAPARKMQRHRDRDRDRMSHYWEDRERDSRRSRSRSRSRERRRGWDDTGDYDEQQQLHAHPSLRSAPRRSAPR